ncbi:hypothetical protein AKJ52_02925, partial [candidate division MSBL1 archaeon SCGC-AAA382C18]
MRNLLENKKLLLLISSLTLISFLFLGISNASAEHEYGEPFRQYETPGSSSVSDLAWEGEHLWVAAGTAYDKEAIIYKMDSNCTTILSTITPPSAENFMGGLAWAGNGLWVSARDVIYKIDTEGNIKYSLNSPDIFPMALAYDGSNLWVAGFHTDKIYKVKPLGDVLSSFNA